MSGFGLGTPTPGMGLTFGAAPPAANQFGFGAATTTLATAAPAPATGLAFGAAAAPTPAAAPLAAPATSFSFGGAR